VNWSNGVVRFSKPMTIESNMLFGILEIHLNKLERIEEEKKEQVGFEGGEEELKEQSDKTPIKWLSFDTKQWGL